MNFYGDYHTHTFYSDGRNSVSDVADGALSKGLKEVAITDHGFYNRFLSLTPEKYRKQQEEIEKQRKSIGDISLLQGVEADIVDASGTVDMTDEQMLNADILLAGFHRFVKSTSIKDFFGFVLYNGFVTDVFGTSVKKKAVATDAFVKAIEKYPIDIITHVGNHAIVDVGEVCRAAAAYGTMVEINMKHLDLADKHMPEMLKTDCTFIVNSDGHNKKSIGNFSKAEELIKKYEIPSDRIANLGRRPEFTRLDDFKRKRL